MEIGKHFFCLMSLDTRSIINDLVKNQKPYRLTHIFGVLQTSLSLAKSYDVNSNKVTLIALLHDCAKHVNREQTLDLMRQGKINISEIDMDYPAIWHGTVGRWVAEMHYGIDDPEILNAVEYHTLGCTDPSMYLKILMCADFCEPTRQMRHVDELRLLIRKDLSLGLKTILNRKIEHLILTDQKPHPGIYETIKSLEN